MENIRNKKCQLKCLKSDFKQIDVIKRVFEVGLQTGGVRIRRVARNGRKYAVAAGKLALAFSLIFAWMFSGWPQIGNFPPNIESAHAAEVQLTKTYSFPSDSESWSASACGQTPGASCAWASGDGSPANGSLEESETRKGKSGTWTWQLSSITWESLGVPAGSTVTAVDGSYNHKMVTCTFCGSTNTSGNFLIRDSGDTATVATLETAVTYSGAAAWAARNASGAQSIGASYQASNTGIILRMTGTLATNNTNGAVATMRQDEIALVITYTVPSITVSGNAYENDSDTSALVACDDSTPNIKLIVATSTPGQFSTTCGNATGAWGPITVDTPAASTTVIVYIDGSAQTYGATVSLYRGSGNIAGLDIRASTTIADYDSADGPIGPDFFNNWDNDNDTDLPYVFTAGQGLTLEQNTKLLIGTSTAAANAVLFQATSTAASTTPGGTFARGGDIQVTSGSTLNMGTNALTVGGLLLNFGTYTSYGTTTFNGTSGSFNFGSSDIFKNLELSGSGSVTASSSFSATSTILVPSGTTLTLANGKVASTSVLSVGGTLTMTGNATTTASSTITTGGTFNSHLRVDVSTASTTLPALTTGNGANLEIFSSSASARGVTFTGNQSITGAFLVNAAGAGNLTVDSETNDPTVSVTGNLDFIGGGAGTEILSLGTGAWTVAGGTDFTDGTFGGNSASTFIMSGTNKTLTSASQTFRNLTLSGSITLGDNVSVAGNPTLANGTVSTGQTLTLTGANTTLSITGGSLTLANLTINSGASTTLATNDLAVSGTLTVTGALAVGSGRIASSTSAGTLTLAGTIHGAGTTTIANSTLGTGGVLNSNVQFDASAGDITTMPARTYGGNVEIYADNAAARAVTMAAGTHTINGAGGIHVMSMSGGLSLKGDTNSASATISGDVNCMSGGGGETILTGSAANTWAVSGNIDFSNCTFTAGTGNTLQMSGVKTLASNGQALNNLTIVSGGTVTTSGATTLNGDLTVNSGTTLTLGSTLSVGGNVTLGGSSVLLGSGNMITLSGTGKNLDAGGGTIHNLLVTGGYALTANSLTVSTSTVQSSGSLTVGSGLTLTATSTVGLVGTINGVGTTTFGNTTYACSNVPSGGTLSSNVQIDATGANCTLPARVYGANLAIYSIAGAARQVSLSNGSTTISGALMMNAASSAGADLSLLSVATTEMHITGDISYLNGGAASEVLNHTSGIWYVSGNANFSPGVFTAPTASSTWIMTGTGKTLTPVAPFDNLYLTGSITLGATASTTGDAIFSGTVAENGKGVVLASTDAANFNSGGNLISSLWVRGPYTLTGSDLTVGTSTIDNLKSLTVGAGREVIATSTMTVYAISVLDGTGTTTFGNASYACTNRPTSGAISVNLRFDTTAGNCSIPFRSYVGFNTEIYSSSNASARTVTLTDFNTYSFSTLLLNAAGSQDVIFDASAGAGIIATNIDYVGLGGGAEKIITGATLWNVGGNADFSGGAFVGTSGGTLQMSGSGVLTSVAPYANLTLSGSSVTLGSNASSTGNVVLSGTVSPGTYTLTLAGVNKSIQGGGNALYDLTIPSGASSTLSTSNLSVSNILTVAGAFEIGSGRTATSATANITGTLHGSGTSTVQTSLTHSGVINSHVRFDVTNASSTMPAATYGGNVEVYNSSATSRGVYIPVGGTATLNSALLLNAAGSGNVMLIGTSSTLTVSGAATYIGNGSGKEMLSAGTENWTFNSALNTSGGIFGASSATTTIKGNYTNTAGTFIANSGVVDFAGTSQQTITGNATGTNAFYKLAITNTSGTNPVSSPSVIFTDAASTTDLFQLTTPGAQVHLAAGKLYTFQNTAWTNPGATLATLYSSSAGTQSTIYIPGTQDTVSYIGFKDMTCGNGTTIDASGTGNNDATGNGECISFSAYTLSIVSAANQIFEYGQAPTAISQITVTSGIGGGVITAGNELRIAIATSSVDSIVDMRWDTTDTTATLAGSGQSKTCSNNPNCADITYDPSGSVMIVPVDTNFSGGQTLIISDLAFANFNAAAASSSALRIFLNGASDFTPNATNTAQYVVIKGKQTLANHAAGHESNKLAVGADTSVTNVDLSSFKLTPAGESVTISQLVFALSGVSGFATENITNATLYADYNANGEVDSGDASMMGAGSPSISGGTGSITFSTSFSTSTARNYILQASVSSINGGDEFFIDLPGGNITMTGATSLQTINVTGNITKIKHHKPMGTQGEIDFPPAGRAVVTGGGGGGGASLGEDPNYSAPTDLGTTFSQWASAANAFASDNLSASETTTNDKQDYRDFNFNVPAGNTINGIQVKLEASGSTAAGTIGVELSWNGGASVTSSGKVTNTLSTVDDVYSLGGATDTWGRTWSSTDFSNGNFRVRLIASPSSNTLSVDAIQVRVYHQASGGGGGGGGDVRAPFHRYYAGILDSLERISQLLALLL